VWADKRIRWGTGHGHSLLDVRNYFEAVGFSEVWDGNFLPGMLEWVRGAKRKENNG